MKIINIILLSALTACTSTNMVQLSEFICKGHSGVSQLRSLATFSTTVTCKDGAQFTFDGAEECK